MNRLEAAFRAVMRDRRLADLTAAAAQIGISQPQLSRILAGRIGLTPKTLRALVTKFSDNPVHQFAILSAHLFDEAERSGFPLGRLKIEMRGEPLAAVSIADLPDSLQHQLRAIGDEIKNGDTGLAGSIKWIADVIGSRGGSILEYAAPAGTGEMQVAEPAASQDSINLAAIGTAALEEEIRRRKAEASTSAAPLSHATRP